MFPDNRKIFVITQIVTIGILYVINAHRPHKTSQSHGLRIPDADVSPLSPP
jgi:hypothetical protein